MEHSSAAATRIGTTLGCTAALAAGLVDSVGCASIHHGRRQQITVESEPPGAAVYLGDRYLGPTPVEVGLTATDLASGLRLRETGFEPALVRFDRKASRWVWGDVALALWNGIGSAQALPGAGPVYAFSGMLALALGIDLMTGAILRAPPKVGATLAPRPPAGASPPESVVLPQLSNPEAGARPARPAMGDSR